MNSAMNIGLLVLRLVAGVTLMAHGAQKLGYFKGPGIQKFALGMEARGLKPGMLWTSLAVLGELGGGLSLVFGFLTPLGAAGATAAMLMALLQHVNKGFFGQGGGYEYPLNLMVVAVALGLVGPGRIALDNLFGIALPAVPLYLILSALGLLTVAIGYGLMRQQAAATATNQAPATSH